jgi:RNA polymerase sigma factor (sigma-70 family)
MSRPPSISAEEVLHNAEWVSRLARALVAQPADAGDLAQDTWTAAMASPGERRGSLGAWLTGTMRNLARMRVRAGARRLRHETEAAQAAGSVQDGPSPDVLLERLEAQQIVARHVLELDEPVRQTVLLRYYEGLSAAEIGRRLGVPAGTVRWRLKSGLDQLRALLDQSFDGAPGSRRWAVLLAPIAETAVAGGGTGALGLLFKGGLIMKAAKLAAVIVVLALVALLAWRGADLSRGDSTASSAGGSSAASVAGASQGRAASVADAPIPAAFLQPGAPARRIAGRVVDGKTPVRGARVVATSVLTAAGIRAPIAVATAADGSFAFGSLPPVEYTITASADGRATAQETVDLGDPVSRPPPDRILLELGPCDHGVYGTVTDSSGGVIEGAEIRPGGVSSQGTGAVSGADGRYELCIGPGAATLGVHADGYGDLEIRQAVSGRVPVDVTMTPAGAVVGRVVEAGSGAPVSGALVWVDPEVWTPVRASSHNAATTADGRFRIDDIPPGRYRVGARAPGFAPMGPGVEVAVEAGFEPPEAAIALERGAEVEGIVTSAGAPVAGARVRLVREQGTASAQAISQADGRFTITSSHQGVFAPRVQGYEVVSPARVEVRGARHSGVTIEVQPLGIIRGRVVRDDRPVRGAEVHAGGSRHARMTARSDDSGAFEMRGLQPGDYTIGASSDRAQAFSREPDDVVRVSLGRREVREGVIVNLGGGASIEGTVVAEGGEPLEGVFVVYRDRATGDLCRSWADHNGRFVCPMLAGGGSYLPSVRPSPAFTGELPAADSAGFPSVDVPDGRARITGQRLVVRARMTSIRGLVVSHDGSPVADAVVRASETGVQRTPASMPGAALPFAVSDAEGAFELRVWDGMRCDLFARSPAGGDATATGVRAGQSGVTLRMTGPGRIEGQLSGFAQPPTVRVRRHGDALSRQVRIEGNAFTVPGLPAGPYSVWATSADGGAAEEVAVAPDAAARVALVNRGAASIEVRVVDFTTGQPVQGVTCRAEPRLERLTPGSTGPAAPVSDADGHMVVAAPAGGAQVYCPADVWLRSDGFAASVDTATAGTARVTVPVALMRQPPSFNSVGVRLHYADASRRVTEVRPGSSAAAAGIRAGDEVTEVNGSAVDALTGLGVAYLIGDHQIGETIALTLRRADRAYTVTLPLEAPWW